MRKLVVLAAVALVAGCSGESKSDKCVEGRTVECACPKGAKGTQSCNDKGAFDECKCGAAATGAAEQKASGDTQTAPGGTKAVASGAPSCAEVVRHVKELAGPDLDLSVSDGVDECIRKKWPVTAMRCTMAAETFNAAAECMTSARDGEPPVKKNEARELVKKIYDGARAYYMDPSYRRGSITPIPPQFPSPSQGPSPPLGTCCAQGGKCAPDYSLWTSEVWTALQFSVDDPHFYSYSYTTSDPYTEFTARANGDLDCDDVYSTYEMYGIINSIYADGPAGTAAMMRVRELE